MADDDLPELSTDKKNKANTSFIPNVGKFLQEHPIVRRFFTGATPEETGHPEIPLVGTGPMMIPGTQKLAEAASHAIDPSDQPFYTGVKPFLGGLAKFGIETAGSGFDPRTAGIKKLPEVAPPPKPQLALPPARETFIAGPSGVRRGAAPASAPPEIAANIAGLSDVPQTASGVAGTAMNPAEVTEANRLQNLTYGPAEQYPGTRLKLPPKKLPTDLPPVSGETTGGFSEQTNPNESLGYPLDIVPNRLRPRTAQSNVLGTTGLKGQDLNMPELSTEKPTFESGFAPNQPPNIEPPEVNIPKVEPPAATPEEYMSRFEQPTAIKAPKTPRPTVPPPMETPSIPTNISPKEAVQNWGWGRNSGKVGAQMVRDQFANLADQPELVGKFQEGSREGPLAAVSKYFDQRFKQLVDAGVLDPQQYKENYLKQLWEEPPDEVTAVFNKNRIAKEPGLSKESTFKSYKEGIAAGLTPKYDNIADIAAAFEKEFTNAIHDKQLYDYFIKNKMLASNKALKSPFEWRLKPNEAAGITKADKDEAVKMIENYFSKSPEGLHNVANVVSATKNLALTQGAPFRTGQISAHGINVLESNFMAHGLKDAVVNFFKGSVNPETDVQFVKENMPFVKKLVSKGLNWTDIEDHSALNSDKFSSLIDKIPGVGSLNVARRRMFEDPLFRVHLPATKLRIAAERYQQLLPKIGEEGALRGAAEFANDFAGGVDKTFRNKTYQDIARIVTLAPDWLESRFNIASKGLRLKPGYVAPLVRGTVLATLPVAAGIAKRGVSGYLNSKPAESTGVELGQAEGKNRNIEPLGTAVEPQRTAIQVGTQLSQGNLGFPFRYGRNKLSPPLQAVGNLGENVDPFGNPLYGKDRFGRHIPGKTAAANIGQELIRPFTPNVLESLIDYERGKAPAEEAFTRGIGLPINYTTEPKIKERKSLPRLK